jgi:hypothetical protein
MRTIARLRTRVPVAVFVAASGAVSATAPAAAVSSGPPTAGPVCVPEASVSGANFDYAICGLPDLDQHRLQDPPTYPGLPGGGGSYCAPTSAMDAFAYFASHGAPALRPGDEDWTETANYNTMTADILALGADMGTSATAGTTGAGFRNGVRKWLGGQPLTDSVWVTLGAEGTTAPTLAQLAAVGASSGGVVILDLSFIRYETPPAPATGPEQWFVGGGHVVTMSSAQSPGTIGLHDPATPTARLTYQDPYTQETYTVTPVALTFGHLDTSAPDGYSTTSGTYLQIDNYTLSASFNAKHNSVFVTDFSVIAPETITGWPGPPGSTITFARAFGGPPATSSDTADGQPVVDLVLDPTAARDYYVTQGSTTVWELDTVSGTSTPFTATAGQPDLIGFADGSQTLYVSETGELTAYDMADKTVASAAVQGTVDALAVNQVNGDVLALSADSRLLRIFSSQLKLVGTVQVPQAALAGTGSISIALHGRFLYLHRDGEPVVALISLPATPAASPAPAAVRFVQLSGAVGSKGLSVDDSGRIFVANDAGQLEEYGPAGHLLRGSPFNGRSVGSQFVVNTSYSGPNQSSVPFDTPVP